MGLFPRVGTEIFLTCKKDELSYANFWGEWELKHVERKRKEKKGENVDGEEIEQD